MVRRILKIASPLVAIAITAVSALSLASSPETVPDPPATVTEVTVLPDLMSVSRVLATGGLERVSAESVPESVRAVLEAAGAVLVVPDSQPGGAQ
ncbi:MAG: hypothetical protein KJN71_06090 [Acidimicrobiia bacterium]|nr:hypothetical protein [Acidimicrobiia bacterium]